jgi:acetyl-CoA acetyltransferase
MPPSTPAIDAAVQRGANWPSNLQETNMTQAVHVVGVGMIPFTKPGASEAYPVMGAQAARLALDDAGIDYSLVEQAYVGYVFGDSTAGQAEQRQVEGARLALQHNLGSGGACVVTSYETVDA